ncbi:hypothetical protein Glove_18g69 [Diversispora epigaea]|uniref:Uncharacterized protein n=1 Tax=Diversispora epigaea TaxID=1348612 RepID=A0A397JXE8_9GLOM|nr:hypothetical protein Glove_18g69 [Diversispora epigaea]
MENSDPAKRLIQDKNIWNLAVIDNIDFKEKKTDPEPVVELTAETSLFGMNQDINETLELFQNIIYKLLNFKKINNELIYRKDFDAEVIKYVILSRIDHGCLGSTPNIVILELGVNPNSDEEILHVATMYKKGFMLENHSFLDIVGIKQFIVE